MLTATYYLSSEGVVPFDLPGLSPDEISRNLPRGIYTTFSTNQNGTCVLGFSNHLDRLYTSVDGENARPSASKTDLRRALAELSQSITPAESKFRLQVSFLNGKIYIIHQKFDPLPRIVYEKGVKTITVNYVRDDPRKKDSNFIERSWAERKIVGKNILRYCSRKTDASMRE
jgi:branched-subunit amino acid aminotransferase/4-amino-4-deoxychorismate lyase